MSVAQQRAWFTCERPNPGARLRLFCFPYAGGRDSVYQRWGQVLPAPIEVWALSLPGRPPRLGERPFTRLSEVVEAVLPEVKALADKPVALFGHSMGALTAFQLARRLQEETDVSMLHLFASGRGAPQAPLPDEPIHTMPDDEFREALRRLNGTPAEVLANQELMELMSPSLRADFEVCETYVYQQRAPLDCPISVYAGLQDSEMRPGSIEGWREQTCKNFVVRMFPGDHFFLQTAQSVLLQTLARELYQYVR